MRMSKVVKLVEKQTENARWPIDCALETIDEYEEILVIGRRKGENSYRKLNSALKDTFWWVGVLERVKLRILEEATIVPVD